jgi:hypothetical protein
MSFHKFVNMNQCSHFLLKSLRGVETPPDVPAAYES